MPRKKARFAVCVRNGTYKASLIPRKIYRVLDDPSAEVHRMIRVIDESGEDYLFPADMFVPIEVPTRAIAAFAEGRSAGR